MQPFQLANVPSHSAIATGVTVLACAWFLVAGATVVASPTDTQVARHATVTVRPSAIVIPLAEAAAPAATSVAIAPQVRERIVVEARRA